MHPGSNESHQKTACYCIVLSLHGEAETLFHACWRTLNGECCAINVSVVPDSVQPFNAQQISSLSPYYFGSSLLFGTRVPIAPDDAMRRSDEPLPHQYPYTNL